MTARLLDVLAPALAAAYPVVYLFAQNVADQVTADALWGPLAVTVGAAVVATIIVAIAARESTRAGVAVAVIALLFLTYGHVWTAARVFVPRESLFLTLYGALAAAGVWVVWLLRGRARAVSRALAVGAAALVLLNGWTIARHSLAPEVSPSPTGGLHSAPETAPDVYYLMVDRYAGATALAETYGFDNGPFLRSLEERGFYVAAQSHSNYARSPLSIVSSLSMDYLDHPALKAAADAGSHPINGMLRGSLPLPRALTELGYTYVHVGGLWEPSATNADADLTLRRTSESEFAAALRESTMLGALTPTTEAVAPGDGEDAPEEEWTADAIRAHTLYQLDRLPKSATLPGPKYVFAHVALPHPPYVFDVDGSRPTPEELEARGENENYIRQLSFSSSQILAIVDRIIAESPTAVIVVQSDEGPWPRRLRERGDDFPWAEFTRAELEEKYGILNAYRLPGLDAAEAGLYPTITPVNSFRVVLNAYFDADLELLPDRMYAYPDNHHFYDLFEITDRFAAP